MLDFYLDFVKAIGLLVPQLHAVLKYIIDTCGWINNMGEFAYGHRFSRGISVDELAMLATHGVIKIRAVERPIAWWIYKIQVVTNIRWHIMAHVCIEFG